MKNINYFLLFYSLLFLGACSGLNDPIEPMVDSAERTEIYINRIDTLDYVTLGNVLSAERHISETNSRTITREIKDVQQITNKDGDIAMFIVNYKDNKGFKIFSADKNYTPLLAYSDNGNFDILDTDINGVGLWIDNMKLYLSDKTNISDSVKLQNRLEWSRLIGTKEKVVLNKSRANEKWIGDALIQWQQEGYYIYPLSDFIPWTNNTPTFPSGSPNLPSESYVNLYSSVSERPIIEDSYVIIKDSQINSDAKYRQLLTTQWGQDEPFNNAVPLYTSNPNRFLGCTAVAVGQIIAYKKLLTGYNYSLMLSSYPNYDEIAKLLYFVGKNICGINYISTETGATIHEVKLGLMSYRIECNLISNFDVRHIEECIKSNNPVFVGGSGNRGAHAWVVDGYDYRTTQGDCKVMLIMEHIEDVLGDTPFFTYSQQTITYSESKLYHCNWGWSGDYDGFYVNGCFNPGNDSYNSKIQLLTLLRNY